MNQYIDNHEQIFIKHYSEKNFNNKSMIEKWYICQNLAIENYHLKIELKLMMENEKLVKENEELRKQLLV